MSVCWKILGGGVYYEHLQAVRYHAKKPSGLALLPPIAASSAARERVVANDDKPRGWQPSPRAADRPAAWRRLALRATVLAVTGGHTHWVASAGSDLCNSEAYQVCCIGQQLVVMSITKCVKPCGLVLMCLRLLP